MATMSAFLAEIEAWFFYKDTVTTLRFLKNSKIRKMKGIYKLNESKIRFFRSHNVVSYIL